MSTTPSRLVSARMVASRAAPTAECRAAELRLAVKVMKLTFFLLFYSLKPATRAALLGNLILLNVESVMGK